MYFSNKLSASHGAMASYDDLLSYVEHQYNRVNGFSTVNLDRIFQGLYCAGAL